MPMWNRMFKSLDHQNHTESWMFNSLTVRDGIQCLACLVNVLENTALSTVHRQLALSLLKSLVEESNEALQLLRNDIGLCCHLMGLISELYTDEPHRQTGISLCVTLIDRLQDETVCGRLMDEFCSSIQDMHMEKKVHFCLLSLGQLCDLSEVYAKILLCTRTSTVVHLLETSKFLEEKTVSSVVYLLIHLIKAVHASPAYLLEDLDSFLWKVMETLVTWMNTGQTHEIQVHCLALLKECLWSHELVEGMLLACQDGSEGHSLLMGLKRLLATKEEALIIPGTQCLTRLMENLTEPQQIQLILDTDLAEFVFEFLHTSNVSQQEVVFQCLSTMANHQLFFDKSHAVYGLDSVLLAIQDAVTSKRALIVEKGLNFLLCLLERQPVTMPLFVNQSWSRCSQLLIESLHFEKHMFHLALKAAEVFLRPQHQQSPVDVKSISELLRTALNQSQHHLKFHAEQSKENPAFGIMSCLLDIAVTLHRLLLGGSVLCGNEEEALQELAPLLGALCSKLVIPWINEHVHYVNTSTRMEQFLACVDIQLSICGGDGQEKYTQLIASGLPFHILGLMSKPYIPNDIRRLGGYILAGLFLQCSQHLQPGLQLSEELLIMGYSKLQWQDQPVPILVEKIASKEEVAAWFCLLYFAYLAGYRLWQTLDLIGFLRRILEKFPDLLSYEPIVVRAYVFLQAYCQANCQEESDMFCVETEKLVLAHLEKTAVEVWFTGDPMVFRWSLSTECRMTRVGRMLVEHWMLHLDVHPYWNDLKISRLSEKNQKVLVEMRHNPNFLHCLVTLQNSQSLAASAKNVLIHCISLLPEDGCDVHYVKIFENLFSKVTQQFEALFVQSTEVNDSLAINMLNVLCALLESPLSLIAQRPPCFKSVYHALKLINKFDDGSENITWVLQYFSSVTSKMSDQEGRTVISPMLQNEKLMKILQDSLSSTDTRLCISAMSLTAWLAGIGIQYQYQTNHHVTVTSQLLLTSLASSKPLRSLPVLKLLNAALSIACCGASPCGAVQFVKKQQNFTSARIFTDSELKQIYLYLQQFIVQDEPDLRNEAMECIKKLFAGKPEIRQYVSLHPWNILMLESFLTSRTQAKLTDLELEFCSLVRGPNLCASDDKD